MKDETVTLRLFFLFLSVSPLSFLNEFMVYLYYNVNSQACCVLSSSSLTDTLRQDMSLNINELSLRQAARWAYPQSNNGIAEMHSISFLSFFYFI
jgi:hypothetical protein